MAAKKKATSASQTKSNSVRVPAGIAKEIGRQMADSLLPDDPELKGKHLEEAVKFTARAAMQRDLEEPAFAMESITGSASERFMRIAIVNDDMPFLVDSIALTLAEAGAAIHRLVHPVIFVKRNDKGRLQDTPCKGDTECTRESMMYIETDRLDAKHRKELEKSLRSTLADVRAAVGDWLRMQETMRADTETISDTEGAALLQWLNSGMLTQLGHVTRHRDGSHSDALGICKKSSKAILFDESYNRAFKWFDDAGNGPRSRAPLIIKSNRMSKVHRHVPLDLFIIPVHQDGKVTALSVHAGIWTSAALAASATQIPVLRSALAHMIEKFDFDPGGHAGKALVHALSTLPHDLVIGFESEDLERVVMAMMSLTDRPRPKLSLVRAPLARHLFAFVWLPRDTISTTARRQIQQMLGEAAGAELLDWSIQVEGGNLAMLRFVFDIRKGQKMPDEARLDQRLQEMVRGWSEAVESELAQHEEPSRALAIANRYAGAFPLGYRANYGPVEGATDIRRLRALPEEENEDGFPMRGARFHRFGEGHADRLHLKIYQKKGVLALSDAVPALENFGFRVLGEVPTRLENGDLGTIHDFELGLPPGVDADAVLKRAETIEEAISKVLNGNDEDDFFNSLIVAAGLDAREAEWLRAWFRYLRQTGMGFGLITVVAALQNAPVVTRGLITLFRAMHDPAQSKDRESAAKKARETIRSGLIDVAAINDDRLLRLYMKTIDAILRTNAFAPLGQAALAFKFDSAGVPGLPKPLPWREIFVYSRRVEGIHLRAGPVARGGLRWSDRRDDFRTEILGLMKAQRVKNAVIVPTGAKGGFYPKQLPDPTQDRDGWLAEGQASYEVFITALLSITDNLVENVVVHPEQVVIRDGDDPYFVVAADKGTASYSDVANGIADAFDFWLDDAFASGGSKGYDHKAMGITARGAWVSVQRHFLEMGVDVQEESIEVVGVGDMSGDVFGNGMLLSKAIKLVAAFDHRDIFIDPDPDPAVSWKERERLFKLGRSSWKDYDQSKISKGGGVFSRAEKTIKLSPEARRALGLEEETVDPETLMSAILKAPADLLWFGGIGTYVKASSEANSQVGDPANDAIRVDGEELRVKAVGEGANLGITQAGRIQFALAGGRINTDFIDNSAGVDCSDNEVNIKIALAAAKREGKLTEQRRVNLLEKMTDDVADIVLDDNRLQALALSIAERGGSQATGSYVRLVETLEDRGYLDRRTEGIADGASLVRRANDGQGLVRPELAVLLSSSKLVLQDAIENSTLPDDPALERELYAAFPEPMRKKFKDEIANHRLRRELIATKLANRIVNRLGLVHPFELVEEEGVSLAQVASAFVSADRLFDLPTLFAEIEQTPMDEKARLELFDRVAWAIRTHVADLLRSGGGQCEPSVLVARLSSGIVKIDKAKQRLLAEEGKAHSSRIRQSMLDAGAPDKLVEKIAELFELDGAIGLVQLACESDVAPVQLTKAFVLLGKELGLDWAQTTASQMNPSDPWERLLVAGLAQDFQHMRLAFLRRVGGGELAKDPVKAVEDWSSTHAEAITQFRSMVRRAQNAVPVAAPMLAQIASQARNLLLR